jgi:VWFA-related protein
MKKVMTNAAAKMLTAVGVVVAMTGFVVTTCQAQESVKPQEPVKVFVEEVRIPITAKDSSGRFDPTLELNDLLVKENGVAQPLQSVYRTPASVLLLLDTGEELNRAKNVRLTRDVAAALISTLRPEDQIEVVQVNNRVELLQSWTTDQSRALKSLNQLLPAKHSAVQAGLLAAVEQFNKIAPGNSHLVLVSDGVDAAGRQSDLRAAYQAILAANVTLHVISYASLGAKVRPPTPTRPRVKSAVAPELIESLPRTQLKYDPTPDLKSQLKHKGGVVLDIDLLFARKGIKPALAQRSDEFLVITEETGGNLWLPTSGGEMVNEAREVARDVDSQYVLSYKPIQPLNEAVPNEYRRLEVISRRVGLTVTSRRGYVVNPASLPTKSESPQPSALAKR